MHKRCGSASMMVLLVGFVGLTAVFAISGYSAATLAKAQREERDAAAFQVAQATLEYQVAISYQRARELGQFEETDTPHDELAASITPGATASATVEPVGDNSRAWVTSFASYRGRERSLRMLIGARDVSIWNNAIFAGTGASGQSINGNVDIRGSVHILGDGEPFSDLNGNGMRDAAEEFSDTNGNGVWDPGEPYVDANGDGVWNSAEPYNDSNHNGVYDPPLTTTDLGSDLSGTAHIGNNYSGMPAALEAQLPPPPIVAGQETLNAELRVKHGRVAISGNATVGSESDPDGGLSKGRLDGVFVTDGFTGNQGAASVHSDNGPSNGYDLGHLGIKFPFIDGIGAEEYTDSTGGTYTTHKSFLDARAMTVNVNSITPTTASFAFIDPAGNSIRYIKGVKQGNTWTQLPTLQINGIVKINGNLLIDDLPVLRYSGRGTIYATQDIQIGNSVLPAVGTKFPTQNVIGMIAGRNMGLATGNGDSQLSMMGAFYAQGTIQSAKQNQIAGTFVANFFDMGRNVPNIYQAPALRLNMPPGMPGDEPIVSLSLRSWRDRH